jgi:hypothetical protein
MTANPLARFAGAAQALAQRARRNPVDHVAWLPYQIEFLTPQPGP